MYHNLYTVCIQPTSGYKLYYNLHVVCIHTHVQTRTHTHLCANSIQAVQWHDAYLHIALELCEVAAPHVCCYRQPAAINKFPLRYHLFMYVSQRVHISCCLQSPDLRPSKFAEGMESLEMSVKASAIKSMNSICQSVQVSSDKEGCVPV